MDCSLYYDSWNTGRRIAIKVNTILKLSFYMVVYIRRYLIQFLVLVVFAVWIAIFQIPDSRFRIIACDVGQGDAILVTYKNIQILTDGGPNNKVLDCLGKYLPFWDREIELVILTHPEKDHYFGLIEVFRRYQVDNFLFNPGITGTSGYEEANIITPDVGKVIRIGLISLDVLWPPPGYADSKSNNLGIVYLLKYGNFEALLTADVENKVSDEISANPKIQNLDYIKVNHHGSKNGLSEKLLEAVEPEIAVISAGKNNPYGHPHNEILQMLNKINAKLLRTDLVGDVVVETDGEKYWAAGL